MHHALEIQEILSNIFGHCHRGIDQASLARTCRAFKEPALDLIWEELPNLCPLAKCLPEISYWQTSDRMCYTFSRPLMQTDWDLLQSYTCRVRRIMDFKQGLTKHCLRILSNPPTAEPLFPNLRDLRCYPGPLRRIQVIFTSLSESSPNISRLHLHVAQSDVTFDKLVSKCICQWQNLRTVDCPEISLDTDALAHLSHMPALTQLTFKLMVTLPDRISPLLFPNLHVLTLHSASMGLVLDLLSQIRLPLIHFTAFSGTCPSRQEFSSFLATIQTFNSDHVIENLLLCQTCFPRNIVPLEVPLLCFPDLRPCMAFSNLRYLYFDFGWNVSLTDSDILALASGWPNLESFMINATHGWGALDGSGITPNGLLQLLQTCRLLSRVSLAMDTRGYTEPPPAKHELTLQPDFLLELLDSIIETESVPAVCAFFAGIMPPGPDPDFSFSAWTCFTANYPGSEVYRERWRDVWKQVRDGIIRRS